MSITLTEKQEKGLKEAVARWKNHEKYHLIQVSGVLNCLEGNTMSNRGAYSTKERMPSDIESPSTNQPGRLYLIGDVLPSRQLKV